MSRTRSVAQEPRPSGSRCSRGLSAAAPSRAAWPEDRCTMSAASSTAAHRTPLGTDSESDSSSRPTAQRSSSRCLDSCASRGAAGLRPRRTRTADRHMRASDCSAAPGKSSDTIDVPTSWPATRQICRSSGEVFGSGCARQAYRPIDQQDERHEWLVIYNIAPSNGRQRRVRSAELPSWSYRRSATLTRAVPPRMPPNTATVIGRQASSCHWLNRGWGPPPRKHGASRRLRAVGVGIPGAALSDASSRLHGWLKRRGTHSRACGVPRLTVRVAGD